MVIFYRNFFRSWQQLFNCIVFNNIDQNSILEKRKFSRKDHQKNCSFPVMVAGQICQTLQDAIAESSIITTLALRFVYGI